MPEELFTIGRFARLCRLSVKQLRHYDDLDLLRPAHVDADSGYRYYDRNQARTALTIALLRSLDVSLPTIADVLAGKDGALQSARDKLDAQITRQRGALRTLDRLMADGLPRNEVTLSREPARKLAVVRTVCAPEDIGVNIGDCVQQLLATHPGWPVIGLFPVDLTPQLTIAVGVETSAAATEHLPSTVAAVATHVGPYEELPLTYHALFAWIHERGHEPHGLVREVYLTDPTTTEPAQLVTRVIIPITEEP